MDLKITGLKIDQGPGSRGGRIIGTTKSGKPIYDTASHPDHKGFSAQDHKDAALQNKSLHLKAKENAAQAGHLNANKETVRGHNEDAAHHLLQAERHARSTRFLAKKKAN